MENKAIQHGSTHLRTKVLCAIIAVLMIFNCSAALATDTAPEPGDVPAAPVKAEDIVATVNGETVTGEMVLKQYDGLVSYYGEPQEGYQDLYYAVAMDNAITMLLIQQEGASRSLDQFTQEEIDAVNASSDAEWMSALDNYVNYYNTFDDFTPQAQKDEAYAQAEAYYTDLGYSKEILRETNMETALYARVIDDLCKDVNVTDEDVSAAYQETVDSDRALYENDINAYETQLMMCQYGYADALPTYHPEGYRFIKHILLAPDSDLLTAYNDLVTAFSAQTDETAAEDLVTTEAIEEAKAAVLASVQTQIDEIYAKLAEGAAFEDLIAEYGSDPGMTSDSYPNGYEVAAESSSFIPEFVNAAFSLDAVGDISVPYVSKFGVHIVKYIDDVPGGPVALTDEAAEAIRASIESELSNTILNEWRASADVQYTGVLRTVDEVQADAAQAAEAESQPAETETQPEEAESQPAETDAE